jgi:hypothetical protein
VEKEMVLQDSIELLDLKQREQLLTRVLQSISNNGWPWIGLRWASASGFFPCQPLRAVAVVVRLRVLRLWIPQ